MDEVGAVDPSPTGGRRGGKRDLEEAPEPSDAKEARRGSISREDEATLRLLASVPVLHSQHRDARGRRRAISITSSQLVEAGLAEMLDSSHVRSGSPREAAAPSGRRRSPRHLRRSTARPAGAPRDEDEESEGEEPDVGAHRPSTEL